MGPEDQLGVRSLVFIWNLFARRYFAYNTIALIWSQQLGKVNKELNHEIGMCLDSNYRRKYNHVTELRSGLGVLSFLGTQTLSCTFSIFVRSNTLVLKYQGCRKIKLTQGQSSEGSRKHLQGIQAGKWAQKSEGPCLIPHGWVMVDTKSGPGNAPALSATPFLHGPVRFWAATSIRGALEGQVFPASWSVSYLIWTPRSFGSRKSRLAAPKAA